MLQKCARQTAVYTTPRAPFRESAELVENKRVESLLPARKCERTSPHGKRAYAHERKSPLSGNRVPESSYKSECQEKNLPRWLDADTFFGLGIQPNLF